MTRVWVDADGLPRLVQEVLIRAATRRKIPMTLVADRWINLPPVATLAAVQVPGGPDAADDYIVEHCEAGDLVVSADVPLAARAVEKGAEVLQHRGRLLDANNVAEHLSVRDFNTDLRDMGVMTSGPSPFNASHKADFANALDRWITRHIK
jgi:hypothetical protein